MLSADLKQVSTRRAVAAAVYVALASISFAAGAQESDTGADRDRDDDRTESRRERCGRAAHVLDTGQPAHRFVRAAAVVSGCGDLLDAGSSLAAGLNRMRASSDTAVLFALERATFDFVDGNLFDAALSIGGDPGSSAAARAVSLAIVLGQVRPDELVLTAELFMIPPPAACPLGILSDTRPIFGRAALPADAVARAITAARAIVGNPTAPPAVLMAASCVIEGASP